MPISSPLARLAQAAAAISAALAVSAARAEASCLLPLVITEVHVDGLEDPASEWFELTNAGAVPIDLSAWSFSDQATQGSSSEGSIRFFDGLVLGAFQTIVIAHNGDQFAAEFGREADFEYGVDSVAPIPFLDRASTWSTGRSIELANSADELLLLCGDAIRDAVRWGVISDTRLAAPSPAYNASNPGNGPRTFERVAALPWPVGPGDFVSSRCPSPGLPVNPDAPPTLQPMRVFAPLGAPIELQLAARDPAGDPLSFAFDPAGLTGTLTHLGSGRVRYTPPVGTTPFTTSFRFTAADACSTTHRQRVDLVVGPVDCDPGQAGLLFTEVAPERGGLAWVELTNTGEEEVDLAHLRLGTALSLEPDGAPSARADTGLTVFPPGTVLPAGASLVIANSAGRFRIAFDDGADFEWFRDSDLTANELPLDPRGGTAAIEIPRPFGHIILYACDGGVIDTVFWAPPDAPAPAGPAEDATGTARWSTPRLPLPDDPVPLSYERRTLVDTDGAADWFDQRCPTPGAWTNPGAVPSAVAAAHPLASGATLNATFTTSGGSGAPTFRAWASAGTLELDPATGAFSFTPPTDGLYALTFEVSEGCLADQAVVRVCAGTSEVPGDAVDEDCDGVPLCFQDLDGDGFGSAVLVPGDPVTGCVGPGLAEVGGDCDDEVAACGAACHPGADEVCDGFDNDCDPDTGDGEDDPDFGAPCDADDANQCEDDLFLCADGALVCVDDPAGDEARVEVCDALDTDEDCDGFADDLDPGGALGKTDFFEDRDGDGYGAGLAVVACDAPPGHVTLDGDCDDDPGACGVGCNPGLTESRLAGNCADGFDNDCDETTDLDEACFEPVTCFRDRDGDGFGDPAQTRVLTGPTAGAGCLAFVDGELPAGAWVGVGGDCDDDPAACGAACRPGGLEVCDGFDNDCDPATVDGAQDPAVGAACDSPVDLDQCLDEITVCQSGVLACPNNPIGDAGRIEVCDPFDVDEDCDGGADDLDPAGDALGKTTFYVDADGDGRGNSAQPVLRCDAAPGFSALGGDCDDDPAACGAMCRPGLVESRGAGNCSDGFDNDCDGMTDNDPECFDLVLCYLDRDGDTYGDFQTETILTGPAAEAGCALYSDGVHPVGSWVGNGLDCDDDPSACGAACNPGAAEICDGRNNDCSALTPDGSGDARVNAPCDSPDDADLCLDDRTVCSGGEVVCVNVTAGDALRVEVCDPDEVDEDCDGGADDLDPQGSPATAPLWYRDADGDTFGDPAVSVRRCRAPVSEPTAEGPGWVANALDCDDDPEQCGAECHPGRAERCDGWDNDCDPATADGSGDPGVGEACDSPDDADLCEDDVGACVGGALVCLNVEDGDEGRVEVCDDAAVDEDCDGFADDLDPQGALGKTTFYRDADGDEYGDAGVAIEACVAPAGYVPVAGDCDDDPAACGAGCHPGLEESIAAGLCGDGLDNDCDGTTDAGELCEGVLCYADADGDGHGDPGRSVLVGVEALPAGGCGAYDDGENPVGFWVGRAGDCDDGDEGVNPDAAERAGDELDEDCDGMVACWVDADGDGFAMSGAETALVAVEVGCLASPGLTSEGGDCDDDPAGCGAECSPALEERCDGRDNDCDGATDEGCGPRVGVLGGGSGCGAAGAGDGVWWAVGAAILLAGLTRWRRRGLRRG